MKFPFLALENFPQLYDAVSGYNKTSLYSVSEGAKIHIAASVPGKKLFVASDLLLAKKYAFELKAYGVDAIVFPTREDVLLYRKSYSSATDMARAAAFSKIARGDFDVICCSAENILEKITSLDVISDYTICAEEGKTFNLVLLSEKLAEMGYTRVEQVYETGDFSVRGDIVDVYAAGEENPVRISFFDNEIESVHIFNVADGSKIKSVKRFYIPPVSDVICTSGALKDVLEVNKTATGKVKEILSELIGGLKSGALSGKYSYLLPYFETTSLTELDLTVIIDEPKVVAEKLSLVEKEFLNRFKTLQMSTMVTFRHKKAKDGADDAIKKLGERKQISVSSLTMSNPMFSPDKVLKLSSKACTKYCYDFNALLRDIRDYQREDFKIVIMSRDDTRGRTIQSSLLEEGISPIYDAEPVKGKTTILPCDVTQGFLYLSDKLLLVGSDEILGKGRTVGAAKKVKGFEPPKEGDYVVHSLHGVGICEGTAVFDAGEYKKEYLSIRYEGGDHLYVAIDQMDCVTKFIGETNPPLNKLGGKDFRREKEKVKKSVKKLAINLLALYAEREKIKGHKYAPDGENQRRFEDAFEYEETDDQLRAIAEIKKEMESGKVIDRLICGDVGFGKTEVALRIMFKTAMEGKQACLIAPTTILCKQHYDTLTKRLEGFNVNAKLLTRFQTASERAEILKGLKSGEISIVVASHRILSKEVQFCDLGLLVLDEEQRFGVEHKETLKERNPSVNTLTLSATPIPRTLNMSLSGVRDISLLETPPQGRLPVETSVIEYSDALIKDAVEREHSRGGQVFILYNKVETIADFTAKVASIVGGGIKIRYAHGQMHPRELENTIEAFYEKQYDVLVATTIIENGIDLPDANTLIVIDSQNFGLSQLYQLRGRVGRRGALAKAYFTIPPAVSFSETAQKRFDALLENTDIGSGFKISLADLSIRGAGSILGAEQHGHIERVGYEMYIEILEEAIKELKTGETAKEENIEFKIAATTYIPSDYVSARDKIKMYKRISALCDAREKEALVAEFSESYGAVPIGLKNLMNIALIKNLVKGMGVKSVIVTKQGAGINFVGADVFKDERILKAVSENKDKVVLTTTIPPALIFDVKNLSPEDKLETIANFLVQCD